MRKRRKTLKKGMKNRISLYIPEYISDSAINWLNNQESISGSISTLIEQYVNEELMNPKKLQNLYNKDTEEDNQVLDTEIKTIKYNLTIGNDNGSSEHDLVINEILYDKPNVMSILRELPNSFIPISKQLMNNLEDNIIISSDSTLFDNNYYYIGNNAIDSKKHLRNIEVGPFYSKIDNDIIVITTLGYISAHVIKKEYQKTGNIPVRIDVEVDMATSLPVEDYKIADKIKQFSQMFLKENYLIKFHLNNKTVEVIIKFNFVKTLPESVPIIFKLQQLNKDYNSKIRDEKRKQAQIDMTEKIFLEFNKEYNTNIDGSNLKNKKILHLSIGEGTTEYPLTKDIRFNTSIIRGSNNGVGHAIKEILPGFMKSKYLVKYSRQDFSSLLKNLDHKYHSDAKDIIELPLEEQAYDILTITKDMMYKYNDIDYVCVHGGGSILMKDLIYSQLLEFGKKLDIKIIYIPKEYAVILESLGLYSFANSDLFKALKAGY